MQHDLLYRMRCVIAAMVIAILSIALSVFALIALSSVRLYKKAPVILEAVRKTRNASVTRWNKANDAITEASNELQSTVKNLRKDWTTAGQELQSSAKTAKQVVQKTDRALFGDDADPESQKLEGYYGVHGIVGQLSTTAANVASLTASARFVLDSLDVDLKAIHDQIPTTVEQANLTLGSLRTALGSLETAIKENSPKAGTIADRLAQDLLDLDALISNADIQKTLAHVEGITETTDTVLMPYRKKASLLKRIVMLILGLVKVTVVP